MPDLSYMAWRNASWQPAGHISTYYDARTADELICSNYTVNRQPDCCQHISGILQRLSVTTRNAIER